MAEQFAEELEKKAIDVIRNQSHKLIDNFTQEDLENREISIFLAGYHEGIKAGRPQWHKVADGDLPKEQKEYWCKVFLYESEETFNGFLWYDLKTKSFMFEEDIEEGLTNSFNVKEWCEIPTFDKE